MSHAEGAEESTEMASSSDLNMFYNEDLPEADRASQIVLFRCFSFILLIL